MASAMVGDGSDLFNLGAQYQQFCSMQASIPPLSTSHCWRKSADINSGIKAHGCFVYWSQDMRMTLDY